MSKSILKSQNKDYSNKIVNNTENIDNKKENLNIEPSEINDVEDYKVVNIYTPEFNAFYEKQLNKKRRGRNKGIEKKVKFNEGKDDIHYTKKKIVTIMDKNLKKIKITIFKIITELLKGYNVLSNPTLVKKVMKKVRVNKIYSYCPIKCKCSKKEKILLVKKRKNFIKRYLDNLQNRYYDHYLLSKNANSNNPDLTLSFLDEFKE